MSTFLSLVFLFLACHRQGNDSFNGGRNYGRCVRGMSWFAFLDREEDAKRVSTRDFFFGTRKGTTARRIRRHRRFVSSIIYRVHDVRLARCCSPVQVPSANYADCSRPANDESLAASETQIDLVIGVDACVSRVRQTVRFWSLRKFSELLRLYNLSRKYSNR